MARGTDSLAGLAGRLDWIEVVAGFACNCRCRVCTAALAPPTARLEYREMAAWLSRGRELGATGVWFGGGEPTLHEDLVRAVACAASLGYRRVRLQSNGLRLAYPAYVAALRRAGMTEASLLVMGWDARSHDRMLRHDGAWKLLGRAMDNLRDARAKLEADVLLTTPLLPHLADLVEELSGRGVRDLTFWLMSLHGLPADPALHRLTPAIGSLRAPLREAFARARACGIGATSLHTPPCALAPGDRKRYRHAGRYRLLVVVPGAPAFLAERSPMEAGEHPRELCGRCAVRKTCLGLRAEQLRLNGTTGLVPVGPGQGGRRRSPPASCMTPLHRRPRTMP